MDWGLGVAEAVDPLINAVHDSSDLVRLAAVRALVLLGAPRSLPHLLAARHDSTGQVVEAATDGLIALDPDLLESTLLNLFDDSTPADRTNAARGLARLGSAVALSRLVAALVLQRRISVPLRKRFVMRVCCDSWRA